MSAPVTSLLLQLAPVESPTQTSDVATPADPTARSLTVRMLAGDREALAQLFALRCAMVEREAARTLGHRTDLMPDAAQEAWLRIARKPVHCADGIALDAWLRRVSASAAIDLLRSELARRVRERRFAQDRAGASAFMRDAAQLDAARSRLAALAELAHEDRALLELRSRTGATLAQLGAALGMGPTAIDSRLRRATIRARHLLEETTP